MNYEILKSCRWKVLNRILDLKEGQILNEVDLNIEAKNDMFKAGFLREIKEIVKDDSLDNVINKQVFAVDENIKEKPKKKVRSKK